MVQMLRAWLCTVLWCGGALVGEAQLQPVGAPVAEPLVPTAAVAGEPDLYTPQVLRTIGLKFDPPASDAARVTAELSIDGRPQRTIGVVVPPSASGQSVASGDVPVSGESSSAGRPWSLVVDSDDHQAQLFGYHTTQLWPGASPEHLWRRLAALASARQYLPAPLANLVLLDIPSRSLGLHVNQQIPDKHFTAKWFDSRGGTRWRVAADGQSALQYRGVELGQYAGYQVESGDHPQAWTDLLQLCQILNEAPVEELDVQLEPILDLDGVLWMLAWEQAWQIADGYVATGAGYEIWRDPQFGRFHLIPVSGEPIVGTDAADSDPALADPLDRIDRADRPLMSRLLANPRLHARYVDHLATIAQHSMDWNVLQPILKPLREAVADRMPAGDTERDLFLAACEGGDGANSQPTLRDFCQRRREFLLTHPAIRRDAPELVRVRHRVLSADADGKLTERHLEPRSGEPRQGPRVGDTIEVIAELSSDVTPESVLLYYQSARNGPFEYVPMELQNPAPAATADTADAPTTARRSDHDSTTTLVYSLTLPKLPAGADLAYYVEARSGVADGEHDTDTLASRFWPSATVLEAIRLHIEAVKAGSSVVRINELMPSNRTAVQDPQGEYEDWVELVNLSDEPVDVSGMYLTDDTVNLRKWQFPVGTVMAPRGRLVVWLDEHTKSLEGLHASFKLSVRGEQVVLVDRDEMNNQILDQIEWPPLRADVAFGRVPDGEGDFHPVVGTPGAPNPDRP